MGITRAQIARQLLAEGGVSLNDAQMMAPDGEFLAYINPKEAGILKAMGGSGRMTNMGIPSFTEDEEDTGDVSNPGGGFSGDTSSAGDDQEDDVARMMADMGLTGPGFTSKSGGDSPQTLREKIINSIKGISRFSPIVNITKGLGNFFQRFRGYNFDGTPKTQAQFELERQNRINQNRIADIMGRKAPFTAMTLENLAKLGYDGPLDDSLIGTTNKMRTINNPTFGPVKEGTMFDAEQDDLGITNTNVANNFIDFNKTIGSEDLNTIQQNIKDATGYDTTLAKNYTKQDMEKLGAAPGMLYGGNEQLEALEDYYNFAQKQFNMGKDPSAIRDSAKIGSSLYGLNLDLVPKDFLETEQDFKQQKSPFELLDI